MISTKMKILFIGTVEFSYKALEMLVNNKSNIVGLVTQESSNFNADFSDLTPIAIKNNIPIIFRKKNNDKEIINFIRNKKPDIIYCFGWSHILGKDILAIPCYGIVGFHPAELPSNRGRHPIIWALFLGLKQTATTFFMMDEEADKGDIISQEVVKIKKTDTARTLYDKIETVALRQIENFTKQLDENKGNIKKLKQDKESGNSWRKRGKEDGKIDFRMSTEAILNLIKALTHPYIGAHIEYLGKDVKVWRAIEEKCRFVNIEPGKILNSENNEIIVKTYDGAIKLVEHEFEEAPKVGEYL